MENWKEIKGYEGLYQISDTGRVKSLHNYRGGNSILKPRLKKGYYTIGLRKNNVRKWYLISRLVADAFIPNPNNLPQVNHKDENKLNNNVDNLEWCSVLYNNVYGTRINRAISKTSKPVARYTLDGTYIDKYSSLSEASRIHNISAGGISSCIKGRYKQCNGYIWKFYEEVMPNANT